MIYLSDLINKIGNAEYLLSLDLIAQLFVEWNKNGKYGPRKIGV